jgi:hypothetical protein
MSRTIVEFVEQLRAAERHQYGAPLSAEADLRIHHAMARESHSRNTLLRRAVGAVAIVVLFFSMRALSNGARAAAASSDAGDAAMIEAGVSRTVEWGPNAGGPRELP